MPITKIFTQNKPSTPPVTVVPRVRRVAAQDNYCMVQYRMLLCGTEPTYHRSYINTRENFGYTYVIGTILPYKYRKIIDGTISYGTVLYQSIDCFRYNNYLGNSVKVSYHTVSCFVLERLSTGRRITNI